MIIQLHQGYQSTTALEPIIIPFAMKFSVFAFLLVVSAAYSESKTTSSEIALSEYLVDYTPVVSASDESSDEDSDEEKTYYRKPAVASYVRMYNKPKYLITYSPPIVPTVQVAPTAAPAYKAPVPSYDRPTVLPYWLRPRT